MITKNIRSTISALVLGLASLVAAPAMLAQDPVALANIPFDFQSGSTHMTPGQYKITRISNNFVQLRGHDTAFAMVNWNDSLQPSKTGKLVFHRYGDQYVLREIWLANDTEHMVLPKSKYERRLRELAQTTPAQSSSPGGDVQVALLESPR